MEEITGVGHRVVHGGEQYAASALIDDDVVKAIEKNVELAPLHNPPNLIGIREAQAVLPQVKQVAVFDTAFHQTMPPAAYLYGLPYELYEKYKIRRYGFHGTSHRYVAARAMELLKRDPENTNVITCHLGNGASVTAIEHGISIDTSMGFTPLEGLMMGTRSGDIDPAIVDFLERRGYSSAEVNSLLNKKSGLLGLSGISNDLRDLEAEAAKGNQRAVAGAGGLRVPGAQVRRRVRRQPGEGRRAGLHRRHRPERREDAGAHLPPAGEPRHLHGLRAQHVAGLGGGDRLHPLLAHRHPRGRRPTRSCRSPSTRTT